MEAWRFRTEGYTTKSGTVLAPPKDFSEVSLMLKALGIPARDIVKLKWTRSEQYQIEQFYIDEQRKLRNKYLKASKANDNKTMIAIADQWYALQDGKDRVRGFFNDAPGKIPRTPISSLTRAEGTQMHEADVYQEALKTGDFREAR